MAIVSLRRVMFNHDDSSATHDALNIRKRYWKTVDVPEWQRGVSVKPEDSPATYSVRDTQGNTFTIQAAFDPADPGGFDELVNRAVDPAMSPAWPEWAVALWLRTHLVAVAPATCARHEPSGCCKRIEQCFTFAAMDTMASGSSTGSAPHIGCSLDR